MTGHQMIVFLLNKMGTNRLQVNSMDQLMYNPGDNDCRVLTLLKPIMSVTYLKAITRQNALSHRV